MVSLVVLNYFDQMTIKIAKKPLNERVDNDLTRFFNSAVLFP